MSVFHKVKEWIAGYLSRPKTTSLLAGAVIFFAATQLGLHFWPSSTLVYGIRIDYLSPTLYLLDILIILYLCLKFRSFSGLQRSEGQIGTFAIPILLVNLLFSQNPLATLSWSLHFLLYLAFVLSLEFRSLPAYAGRRDSRRVIGTLRFALFSAILFQVLLSLFQVFLGHTLQGAFYYFGERALAVGQPGIATAQLFGSTMLRAYGTFSHPNILAGWLVIALLILTQLQKKNKLITNNWILVIATLLTIMGVFLTESRSATLSLFGLVIPLFLLRPKLRLPYYLVGLLVCFIFYKPLLFPSRSDFSLAQRLDLQKLSLQVISKYPVLGTGTQASISTYPGLPPAKPLGVVGLQPDHDSLTLFLSWFGLVGVLAILSLLRPFNMRHSLFFVVPLVPLLLFDHYLLTSPQGLFTLLLYAKVMSELH